MTTTATIPPPPGHRLHCARRSRSHLGSHTDQDMTGILPSNFMWLPIAFAMLVSGVTLAWLLSRPGQSPLGQSYLHAVVAEAAQPAPSGADPSAAAYAGGLSPVFSPEIQNWSSDILRWASNYQVDPNLVATVMQIESCGHPTVQSSAGAIGLFQVMPFHFQQGEDPNDPETNARRGLAYLARGLTLSGGRTDLALAGYNGGHGVIGQDTAQWSAETRRYVTWGSGILDDITTGSLQSPSLQAWLQAGGANLCRRASHAIATLPMSSTP